jgi:Autographiviridae endonuclease VII
MGHTSRASSLKRKYGITVAQWDKMFERQNGLCPICLRKLLQYGNPWGRRASPVDHDHKSGRVRGITCNPCNRFKIAKNTAETAKRLLPYLDSEFDGRNI